MQRERLFQRCGGSANPIKALLHAGSMPQFLFGRLEANFGYARGNRADHVPVWRIGQPDQSTLARRLNVEASYWGVWKPTSITRGAIVPIMSRCGVNTAI